MVCAARHGNKTHQSARASPSFLFCFLDSIVAMLSTAGLSFYPSLSRSRSKSNDARNPIARKRCGCMYDYLDTPRPSPLATSNDDRRLSSSLVSFAFPCCASSFLRSSALKQTQDCFQSQNDQDMAFSAVRPVSLSSSFQLSTCQEYVFL